MSDFKIKDISLADFGRHEILLAENEMPALMQLRENYKAEQAPSGSKDYGVYPYDSSDSSLN